MALFRGIANQGPSAAFEIDWHSKQGRRQGLRATSNIPVYRNRHRLPGAARGGGVFAGPPSPKAPGVVLDIPLMRWLSPHIPADSAPTTSQRGNFASFKNSFNLEWTIFDHYPIMDAYG